MVRGKLHYCMVTDYLSLIMISLYRKVVDVIISNRKLDDITYTGDTLSLLVKHMPGINFSTLVGPR